MDKLFFSLILSVSCFVISAQESWTDYYKDDKIKIQYRYSDCHDSQNGMHRQYVLLRFENHTAENLSVNFSKELWYDGKCPNCGSTSGENTFSVNIPSKGSTEGNCGNRDKSLRIFSKMLDMEKSTLTKFELKNITVTEK